MTAAPTDAERQHWNRLIVPLAKRKETDRMPMPWEAHRLGWDAGRAQLREEIAVWLERMAAGQDVAVRQFVGGLALGVRVGERE